LTFSIETYFPTLILNLKQHYFVWCPPSHIAFLLLEADSLNAVSRYIFSIPMRQDAQIVPVEHLQDTMAMGARQKANGKVVGTIPADLLR
jgi:hypothetical protein